MRRSGWVTSAAAAATVAVLMTGAFGLSAQQQPTSSEQEVQAIREVMEKVISIINGPEFARAPTERRMAMLRPFYRADDTYGRNELPVFFGPLSEPLSRGVKSHLDNMNLNFEWIFQQGMVYGTRIDEMQIEVDKNLAVVLAHTTSGYAAPDNKNRYATRGRATVVLNKMVNGRWVISHEHTELYNPQTPGTLTKEQLEEQIESMKKKKNPR